MKDKCQKCGADKAAEAYTDEAFDCGSEMLVRECNGSYESYLEQSLQCRVHELESENARLRAALVEMTDWIKAMPAREIAFRHDTQKFGLDELLQPTKGETPDGS